MAPHRAGYALLVLLLVPVAAASQLEITPAYTEEGRIAELEGTVWLTVVVAEDGSPRQPRVTKGIGLDLDERALETIRTTRFPLEHAGTLLTVRVVFSLPQKQSRWHLVRADFNSPEAASRPRFHSTNFPTGTGIDPIKLESASIVGAVRREALAVLAFSIDERGVPVNIEVQRASDPMWGPDAIAVLGKWKFAPALLNGTPVSSKAVVHLIWGPRNLTSATIEKWNRSQTRGQSFPATFDLPPIVRYRSAYPDDAENDTVLLSLRLTEDGTAEDVQVIQPSGHGLEAKAVDIVKAYRFERKQPTAETKVSVIFLPMPAN